MIPQNFEYSAPADLKEALNLLAQGAKPLAGGMSLIPIMKLRLAAPDHLVDLGRIQGLNYLREEGNELKIGALTTHFQIESSPLIRSRCPLIGVAASHIGDVQVRNMGTIGGSVAHADPAADYPASLFALEAKFRLASKSGERTVSCQDFFVDTFTTALEPGEIITEVIVPVESPSTGVSYKKMVHPASGFAIVGVAVRVRRESGKISFARIGVTGVAAKPYRATEAEALLTGTAGADADVRKAAAAVPAGVDANSDIHASAEYRMQMASVFASRAIAAALSGAA